MNKAVTVRFDSYSGYALELLLDLIEHGLSFRTKRKVTVSEGLKRDLRIAASKLNPWDMIDTGETAEEVWNRFADDIELSSKIIYLKDIR